MVRWGEFAAAAGELAALGEERFERARLVLVGSIRRNGWPRISPVEPLVVDGQLYLGMMWQSRKALDLLRDARCVVHSAVSDPAGTEGDFKLYGRAREVADDDERERYCQALEAKTGWRPQGDFHLFAMEIAEVGFVQFSADGHYITQTWRPGEPLAPPLRHVSPP